MTTYTADLYSADGIETMRAKFAAAVTAAIGLDEEPTPPSPTVVVKDDPQLMRQNRSAVTVTIRARNVTCVISTIVDNVELDYRPDDPAADRGLYEVSVTAEGEVGIIPIAEKVITGILGHLDNIRPVAFPNHGWIEEVRESARYRDAV